MQMRGSSCGGKDIGAGKEKLGKGSDSVAGCAPGVDTWCAVFINSFYYRPFMGYHLRRGKACNFLFNIPRPNS